VAQLINELHTCQLDSSCYLDTLKRMDIPLREFENYYSWNEENYTRNCVFQNELFEMLLICFEKGQGSPIHDYDSHEAWITVVQGKLREEKFRKHPKGRGLEKVSSVNLVPGDFTFISGQVGIHRYYNIFENRSACLCLYAKPVERWKVYDEKTGDFTEKAVWYDRNPTDFSLEIEAVG
ncbi:MAG: cysteine dioxygenase, partial [Luteibaculum sp.]